MAITMTYARGVPGGEETDYGHLRGVFDALEVDNTLDRQIDPESYETGASRAQTPDPEAVAFAPAEVPALTTLVSGAQKATVRGGWLVPGALAAAALFAPLPVWARVGVGLLALRSIPKGEEAEET